MEIRNKDIELQLKKDQKDLERKEKSIRVALLGPGNSGKTTFLKQLKILYGGGFTHEEKEQFQKDIYDNILLVITTLIEAAKSLNIKHSTETMVYIS